MVLPAVVLDEDQQPVVKTWMETGSSSASSILIREVAELYPAQSKKLDYVMWRQAPGRKIFRDDE
ncbi:hypothetical protein [Arthrobacter sp. 4R501]|uniref:hypothetical protein n=1 Tax=Arthrobacter sp. 4R501 TaxID=2058886 RepID=UPI0011B06CEE|nr:hypothetical protein [Arthrobacter sp. 4R501]